MWGNRPSHSQGNFHIGSWSPGGLPNVQRVIVRAKTQWIEKFFYHWKAIETYMSKMGSHDPFGHLKHKLWQKKRSGVELTIWLRLLKVENRLDFLVCRRHATRHWKALDEGYNFSLDLISIWGLHTKLWPPKLLESQFWQFRDSRSRVLGQKAIWMWASWVAIEYIIRGKVVASSKSGLWWVFWIRVARGSS